MTSMIVTVTSMIAATIILIEVTDPKVYYYNIIFIYDVCLGTCVNACAYICVCMYMYVYV